MPILCSLVQPKDNSACALCNAIFELLYLFTVWPLQSNLYCELHLICLSMGYNLLAGKAFFNPLQISLTVLKLVPEQYFWRTILTTVGHCLIVMRKYPGTMFAITR